MVTGFVIFGLRKGDPRHRRLGWLYVASLSASLVFILLAGRAHPVPFHAYAAFILGAVAAAVLAARLRRGFVAWRSWHGALMSLSMLGAVAAIGGVAGGAALGLGNGPAYYRMFDAVIACVTAAGLGLILTRPVIWGRSPRREDRRARLWFGGLVVASSLALIVAQLRLG